MAATRLSVLLHACLVFGLAAHSLRGGANDVPEDTTDEFMGRELTASSGPSAGPDTGTNTAGTAAPAGTNTAGTVAPVTSTTEMAAGPNGTNRSVTLPPTDVVSSFSADFAFNSSADLADFAAGQAEIVAELESVLGTGEGSVEVVPVYTVSLEYSFTGTVTEDECVAAVVASNANLDANDVACTVTTGSGGSGDGTGVTTTNVVTTTAAPVTSTADPSRRLSSSTAAVVITVDDVSNVGAIATAAEGVTTFGDVAVTASAPTFAATLTFQVTSTEAIQSPSATDLEGAVHRGTGVTVEVSGVTVATSPEAEDDTNRGHAEGGASAVWLSRTLAATLVALGVFKI